MSSPQLPECTCVSNRRNGTHQKQCPARVAYERHRDALMRIAKGEVYPMLGYYRDVAKRALDIQ